MFSEQLVSASVYHKDKDGVLHPHDLKTSKSILTAAASGRRYVRMGCGTTGTIFDLKIMKQLRVASFDQEEIVIEVPWNAKNLRAASRLGKGDSVRRKILEMAIDRIIAEKSLSEILDLKGVPACSVCKNPFLGRGHVPYDNFIDSLLAATLSTELARRSSLSAGEMLYHAIVAIASDGPTEARLRLLEDRGLRLVFHGTNEAVVDDILRTGLLPQFRESGSIECFGIQFTVSMKFASAMSSFWESFKLLFCTEWFRIERTRMRLPTVETTMGKATVLLVVVGGQAGHLSTQITSDMNRFQLPVAEIILKNVKTRKLLLW